MQTNADKATVPVEAPISVRRRRRSHLPFGVPVVSQRLEAREADLKAIQEKFKHITPQEREILRKMGFKLQQGLLALRQELLMRHPDFSPTR